MRSESFTSNSRVTLRYPGFTASGSRGGTRLSIRRVLLTSLVAACASLCVATAQTPSLLPTTPPLPPAKPSDPAPPEPALPDAPSASLPGQQDVIAAARTAFDSSGDPIPSSSAHHNLTRWDADTNLGLYTRIQKKRALLLADQRFLNDQVSLPMTSRQKAFLAATDFADPVNLAVIAASSAVYTAASPESAYGPGFQGFGRNYGYSLAQDGTGEALGTWLIPSLAHQDPRYHRMPGAPTGRRILHALAHTVVSQHDDGSPMPNYATLLTYPISAEIANLYVPVVHTSGSSTAKRVVIGLASDPAEALIGEFLPDVARRIHIRVTFFQQIINNISADHPV